MKLIVFVLLLASAQAAVTRRVVKFDRNSEWALIPGPDYRLRMVHISEVINNVPENRFAPESDTVFKLFTRINPLQPQIIPLGDIEALKSSAFDPTHPTRFTIHGWNGDLSSNVNMGVIDSLLIAGDFNVIVVDWSTGAGTINYITARNRVDEMGQLVAKYVDFLTENEATLDSINIIGHSLGGHIAGIGGKLVSNGRVNAVIALDPAGPLFSYDEVDRRVAVGDAKYVEVIHTNGGLLGFWEPLGDIDFYPNGGYTQPGCGFDLVGTCAHGRAHEFFSESITSDYGFYGYKCDSLVAIDKGTCPQEGDRLAMGGEPANNGALPGMYYLKTDSSSFFALG